MANPDLETPGKENNGNVEDDTDGKTKKGKFRLTIEPYLFLAIFGMMITYLTMQNLMLDKACRVNLNYSDDMCDALNRRDENFTDYDDAKAEVQGVVSSVNTWKFFIDHTIPILFCLVMGAWSDKHGRKPLLLSAQVGYFLGTLSLILSVYLENLSLEATVIMYGIFHGLGGASVAINLGMMAYIGDIATEDVKTQRLGFAMFSFMCATPIGSAVAGPIYEQIGFSGTFGLSAGCTLLAFLYALIFIKETVDTQKHRATYFVDLFDASQVIMSIRTLFRPRKGWLRGKIILLCGLVFFTTFYYGEMSVIYLYVVSEFNWTYSEYGYYNTYRFVVNIVGMAFTLGVISHYFKVSDPMVGIIGCFSQVAASTLVAFSFWGGVWFLYAAPVVDFLNGAVVIVNKAMLTKSVPENELGQLSAVLCTVEAIVPIVCNPLYSAVYGATFDSVFPGATFFVTVSVMLICIAAFLFLYGSHLREQKSESSIHLTQIKTNEFDSKF